MLDLLLTGGHVVDGTGRQMFRADVGIEGGRITAVGRLDGAEAARTIDCQGLCISPGWVDIHGHADWTVLEYPTGLNLLIQGCTTTVAGNCGMCPGPMLGPATELLKAGALRDTSTLSVLKERFPDLTWGFGISWTRWRRRVWGSTTCNWRGTTTCAGALWATNNGLLRPKNWRR